MVLGSEFDYWFQYDIIIQSYVNHSCDMLHHARSNNFPKACKLLLTQPFRANLCILSEIISTG